MYRDLTNFYIDQTNCQYIYYLGVLKDYEIEHFSYRSYRVHRKTVDQTVVRLIRQVSLAYSVSLAHIEI